MTKITIDKTFNTLEECSAWEEINFPNRTYKGHTIMCVNHEENIFDGKIKLTDILVF